jgi:hypothetical protein
MLQPFVQELITNGWGNRLTTIILTDSQIAVQMYLQDLPEMNKTKEIPLAKIVLRGHSQPRSPMSDCYITNCRKSLFFGASTPRYLEWGLS